MSNRLRFAAVTLFPEMFEAITRFGISRRAFETGVSEFTAHNPRDFATDRYKTIDDRPFGGGPGMVMMPVPLEKSIDAAINAVRNNGATPKVIYLSPQGVPLTDALVRELAQCKSLVMVCGRYEGIDERVIERKVDLEVSVGDFVVSGGELPAMMLMDAILRYQPGVFNDAQSAEEDSFVAGLLDCPHYTRPEHYEGLSVPDVLLSGNHEKIRVWRLAESLKRTKARRPDLLEGRAFSKEEAQLLKKLEQSGE
ncbi:MAG: tRNA (guanine(37)-N(1)) methyltransferase [Fluviibacter phosphoraccumulans EoVTN8]